MNENASSAFVLNRNSSEDQRIYIKAESIDKRILT